MTVHDPATEVTPQRIVIDDPTPAGIAGAIGRMIRNGELVPGDRLPTVRDLSAQLGVSPATVSYGWKALSRSGLVVSRGRSGTFVADGAIAPDVPRVSRTATMARTHGSIGLDLSKGSPDPELLPELKAALSNVAERAATTSYHDHPVVPELGDLLRTRWPSKAQALTVVDGALDAVTRSLQAVTRFGDRVIVEDPTFPQFLDLLDTLGLQHIPVPIDRHGPDPDAFARAMAQAPTVALLQPRAHNPTGVSMTASRARDLARAVRGTRCVVIEDDHSGAAVAAPDISLGRWLPDQVVHVRSFSKSHGPDLRIAAMTGPREVIDRVTATRMLGPGWTPRLLQRVLYELLTDEASVAAVDNARAAYRARRAALVEALADKGIDVGGTDGLNVWVPVSDERNALIHLAANGIQVAPGDPFIVEPQRGGDHVRVTIATLRDDVERVAATLAAAASGNQADFYPLR